MTRKATHDRHGSHAGRGFRYQDAVAVMLALRVWANLDPVATIIPEGNDDIERRFATGSALVQVKSRREDLGELPLASAKNYITELWDRHDKFTPHATRLELILEQGIIDHETSPDGGIVPSAKLASQLPGNVRGKALMATQAAKLEHGRPVADFLHQRAFQVVAQLRMADEDHGQLTATLSDKLDEALERGQRLGVKVMGVVDEQRDRSLGLREQTDQYSASVAPTVACVSTIVRLPRPSVSRNVIRKPPFISVPGGHHCKPLHVECDGEPTGSGWKEFACL